MAHRIQKGIPDYATITALIGTMRLSDIEEIRALHGEENLFDVVGKCIAVSKHVFTAYKDNKLVGIFGAAPLPGAEKIGAPWALGTHECSRSGIFLYKCGKYLLDVTARDYPGLINYIDTRQTRNIEWLRRLGFAIYPREPYGEEGRLFHKFVLIRPEVKIRVNGN